MMMTNGGVGGSPYLRTMNPALLASFFSMNVEETARFNRIMESHKFYLGEHWAVKRANGDPLQTTNYIAKIVDRAVEFLAARGFVVNTPKVLTEITLPKLSQVWQENDLPRFALDAAMSGAITGDVFVLVTYVPLSASERRIYPKKRGKVKIQLLPSELCFPTWDPLDLTRMTSIRIETVWQDDRTPNDAITQYTASSGSSISVKRFTQIITPDTIVEHFHGRAPIYKKNILGEIPVIHWPNLPYPSEFYGLSDTKDIVDVQRSYNEASTDIADAVHYHGHPVTVVTGAKVGQLTRDPRKIWSGLPAEAKVQNLALGNDLNAAIQHKSDLKNSMLELGDVPPALLGQVQAISNTSGVALAHQYLPSTARMLKKRASYTPGVRAVNRMILRVMEAAGEMKIPYDVCKNCGGKIADVVIGLEEVPWEDPLNPGVPTTRKMPVTESRCFHLNRRSLDFEAPERMKLSFVKRYGFGTEVREAPAWKVMREAQLGAPSFWDYARVDLQNQAMTEQGAYQAGVVNQQLAATAATTPVATAEGGQAVSGVLVPPPPVAPRLTQPLPPQFIDVPEEPEQVIVLRTVYDPTTGEAIQQSMEHVFVVPTGCDDPDAQDPFETDVMWLDMLPRDKHMEAQYYGGLIQTGIADAKWARAKIPEVAEDADEIEERLANAPQAGMVGPGGTPLAPSEATGGAPGSTTPMALSSENKAQAAKRNAASQAEMTIGNSAE